MRIKLWRDSLENEAVESWSFRVRLSGGAPCMYKYQESFIFVMKIESLLDIQFCSVLLKSFLVT